MYAARHATAITPSDTTVVKFRAIYVGGAGNLAVLMEGDTVATTFNSVPAGSILQIRVQKVMATNTTATNIVGLN